MGRSLFSSARHYVRQMSCLQSRHLLDKRGWGGRSRSKQRRPSAYDCRADCSMPSMPGPKPTRCRVRRQSGAMSSAASVRSPTPVSRARRRSRPVSAGNACYEKPHATALCSNRPLRSAAFSAADKRRRRCTDVMTSTCPLVNGTIQRNSHIISLHFACGSNLVRKTPPS
jgi:hypothetical protein